MFIHKGDFKIVKNRVNILEVLEDVGYEGFYKYWGYKKGHLEKKVISSKNNIFLLERYIGNEVQKNIWGGIFQYLVKLGVFVNSP
jgi:hypothetical protein